MKCWKKMLVGTMTMAMALGLSAGLVACGGDKGNSEESKESSTPSAEVTVAGGYAIYFADQGGVGLELNLYEDGTFYYSQYTSALNFGKYTSEKATGTDSEGREKLYAVTFTENDMFGKETHYIVQDSEGDVYLTAIYDDMSQATRELKKQDEFIEEVVQTVATYWSNDFENDFVVVVLSSDNSYAIDGINGVGEAGSIGTYTKAESEGVITYTLTDETDTTKVYTLTVGAEIKLTGAAKEYTMTDLDPNAKVAYTFGGANSWGASLTLTCYDNSNCNVRIVLEGMMDFVDAKGTWSYVAQDDLFIFIFGSTTLSTTSSGNTYSFEYTINNAQFGGEKVTLSYTKEVVANEKTWTFVYTPKMEQAVAEQVTMTCTAVSGAESYTFIGSVWGAMPVTIICAADGTCSGEIDAMGNKVPEGTGTWSIAGDVITIVIADVTYTANVQA